jgi:hypothetical protein
MLKTVADIVMAVIASFRTKVAKPNDAGLGAPVLVSVGTAGGFSAAFVMFAVKMTIACALVLANRAASAAKIIA